MFVRQRTTCFDLIVGSLYGSRASRAKQLRLDPDRKELRIQTSGPRPHGVEMAVAELLLNIDVLIKNSLHGVDVHIDRDSALMNGKRVGDRSLCPGSVLVVLVHLFISAAGRRSCE